MMVKEDCIVVDWFSYVLLLEVVSLSLLQFCCFVYNDVIYLV